MLSNKFLISVLVLAAAVVPASASLVTYTTPAAFSTATSDLSFQNIAFVAFSGNPYTDAGTGVSFTDGSGLTVVPNQGGSWPAGLALETSTAGSTINVTLPASVQAFAMDVGQALLNVDFTITLSNSVDSTFVHSFGQSLLTIPVFFGFRTDTPITTFSITPDAGNLKIDLNNVQVGTQQQQDPPAPTPEAATMVLIGSGLIGLRLLRRRGKKIS